MENGIKADKIVKLKSFFTIVTNNNNKNTFGLHCYGIKLWLFCVDGTKNKGKKGRGKFHDIVCVLFYAVKLYYIFLCRRDPDNSI